jgi:hypothetical protein
VARVGRDGRDQRGGVEREGRVGCQGRCIA